MTERARLPQRRHSITFGLECNGLRYTATVGFYDDGRLGEIFLGNHRADSHADACAKDSAILASIALQYGVPPGVLRKALLRDQRGKASTPTRRCARSARRTGARAMSTMAISDIKVGKRIRKEMGDLKALAESIEDLGLLNPITVDERGCLRAGARRLAACKQLGWKRIPVNVVRCD
jgi:ParB-like nuclease domain